MIYFFHVNLDLTNGKTEKNFKINSKKQITYEKTNATIFETKVAILCLHYIFAMYGENIVSIQPLQNQNFSHANIHNILYQKYKIKQLLGLTSPCNILLHLRVYLTLICLNFTFFLLTPEFPSIKRKERNMCVSIIYDKLSKLSFHQFHFLFFYFYLWNFHI